MIIPFLIETLNDQKVGLLMDAPYQRLLADKIPRTLASGSVDCVLDLGSLCPLVHKL